MWLTPFCFRTFVSLVISSLSIFFSLSPTPIIWLLRVLTTVSFSSSCSLLAVSLSFYHSSGRFTKLWFLASPLNFVFISTIAFLIFMQEVVYALSLLLANCAWLTSSFLCENIGCSALYNRLVFPPLDIIPSASTFLLSCLPNLPFILIHHSPFPTPPDQRLHVHRGCCSGRAPREPTAEPVG